MKEHIWERYGPYPEKKEKKRNRYKEGPFLKQTYEWLKWKMVVTGGFSFHCPCLEH
ncbi:MAG: hypothetical protein QME83_08670 [Thermodesulfobacteriota bacterium]|nr:hypothetical protein [Thermodesulfobacteriota bacterium]